MLLFEKWTLLLWHHFINWMLWSWMVTFCNSEPGPNLSLFNACGSLIFGKPKPCWLLSSSCERLFSWTSWLIVWRKISVFGQIKRMVYSKGSKLKLCCCFLGQAVHIMTMVWPASLLRAAGIGSSPTWIGLPGIENGWTVSCSPVFCSHN